MAKEVTRGTPVSPPTLFLPIAPNPKLEPKVMWLPDKGLRGSPVDEYGKVPGFRHDEFSFKGNVFADTFPALALGVLGAADVVTGTGPYTHTFSLLNSPSTGSQPPSWTGYDVDNQAQGGSGAKQWSDGMLSQLDIEFTAEGAMTYSAKYLSGAFTEVATPTLGFGTLNFIPAWNGSLTIGTTSFNVVEKGSVSIKRNVEPIYTLGSQSPYRLWAGGISVTGKFTFVTEANDPYMADALATNYVVLAFTFTDPVSGYSVTYHMSKVQLIDPVIDSSKPYLETQVNFTAEANSTDSVVSPGYAPIQIAVTNAQSTSY